MLVMLFPALDVLSTAPSASARVGLTCRGVNVTPEDDLQSLIEARPSRTTFCFERGVYRFDGTLATGTKFPTLDLRSGAVIDGKNGGFVGIIGGNATGDRSGTIVLGGVFEHFGSESAPLWAAPIVMADNWIVKGTEFRHNFNAGLVIQGTHARVSKVDVHHNGRYGIIVTPPCDGCPGPTGVLVQNSEISFNNTRHLSTLSDAGGTKFFGGTDGMIVRGNHVHHNYGSGLWWDSSNVNAQIYGNVVHDNRNWGIFWEMGFGGTTIHDNTFVDNAVGDGTANWGANVQLLISNSDGGVGGGIEVYRNTIDGTAIAIGLLNHTPGMPGTTQVHVHHNVITLRAETARVGALAYNGSMELFNPSANNRFNHNAYRVLDRRAAYWAWNGKTLTWDQWQGAGHDVNGTVRRIN